MYTVEFRGSTTRYSASLTQTNLMRVENNAFNQMPILTNG